MRYFSLMFMLATFPAFGLSLHYGDTLIELGTEKITSPSLVVSHNGIRYYGALYTTTPPAKTLRVAYNDTEYWVGAGCVPGTYAPNGIGTCHDCGTGHWCAGGTHRATCKYGAIGCPDANHSSDGALPDGAPINALMTLDQVNEFVPVTNSDQWQQLSCCLDQHPAATPSSPSELNKVQNACATGTIGPGTYLFFTHYKGVNKIDSITGDSGSMSNAVIVVFDHPVSYASIHGDVIFQHFIDTEHPTYTEWDISTAEVGGWYLVNTNETNISDIMDIKKSAGVNLCVYELK